MSTFGLEEIKSLTRTRPTREVPYDLAALEVIYEDTIMQLWKNRDISHKDLVSSEIMSINIDDVVLIF